MVKENSNQINKGTKNNNTVPVANNVNANVEDKNKAIKNMIVKLTVNKKTYKVKTNSKGIAIFSIKLIKKGKYDAVFKYGGSSNFKSATKNIRITIK